jgi:hypothetical protein
MFSPYGSLLSDGSEDAAFPKALASFPRAGSPAFGFPEGQSTQRKLSLSQSGKLRELTSRPTPVSFWKFSEPVEDITLKSDKQATQINKTAKSRLSRAMKARARLRQQHRMRALFLARNK